MRTLSRKKTYFDKKFFWTLIILLAIGLITFISSSLSLYTEDKNFFYLTLRNQVGFGFFGGMLLFMLCSRIHFSFWQKIAPFIFISSVILTLLVFSKLGFSHGGAQRWISLGFISFQPAEILKFGTVLILSAWFDRFQKKIKTFKYGFLPFFIITLIPLIILSKQPDSSTLILIGFVSFALYWLQGAHWKHILASILLGGVLLTFYGTTQPHIHERIHTFFNPSQDPLGSSFQIRQSLIAIGSGKILGRGLGQSVHKFGTYLPESTSDSIFAIFAEEYGFIGSLVLIFIYSLFTFFGFRIGKSASTIFGQTFVSGIILMLIIQVFLNIGAISRAIPLSGLPLIFISGGGTALVITLASLGIVFNISRYRKKPLSEKIKKY